MGKTTADVVLDAALDKLATATAIRVCSSEPVDRAAAITATLATGTLTGGDFTNANGDTSGRKATIAQQVDLSITATGDANHVAYDDGTTLLHVTTATTQTLTSGGTVTVSAGRFEILDPT